MSDLVKLDRQVVEHEEESGGRGRVWSLPLTTPGYDVRLGPLQFTAPVDTVGETVGDGLEAVGSALVAAERKPRTLKLALAVRGVGDDPAAEGVRLRRQLRQLFDNPRMRLAGLFLWWEVDAQMDCWLLAGSAELDETDPGITFGEYQLTLNDVYVVGRPGTHRPGRRAAILDLTAGQAPRDTRRLLYSRDFAGQALAAEPLMIPGDSTDVMRSGNRPLVSTSFSPVRFNNRHAYRSCAATDAEIVTYTAAASLAGRGRFIELDEYGAVKVWSLAGASVYPPVESGYTRERDESPDVFYGWERVYGSLLSGSEPLAVDNGCCRLIWLGSEISQGLAIEYWDSGLERFKRVGRVLHDTPARECYVVELSSERAVIEWRRGPKAMRAILQRGWWGPRLESYDDGGATARLEFGPTLQGKLPSYGTGEGPKWVHQIRGGTGTENPLLWAQQSADEVISTAPVVISGKAVSFSRPRVLVAQLACPEGPGPDELAALAVTDCRATPVLVARG